MIYITGDTHGEFSRFSDDKFPEQKEMSKSDFVIVCGDFGGVWCDTVKERWWLDWLASKNFTLLFIDGNHENFDRLYGDEFEVVDFHGGKAHKIRDSIYHLMRGYVFELEGKKFFTFGGGRSHDIRDGILQEKDYKDLRALVKDYNIRTKRGQLLRINHVSWWEQELPSESEINFALKTLIENNYDVDFVITHCAPTSIANEIGNFESDLLCEFLEDVFQKLSFQKWFFGHYHTNKTVTPKISVIYEQIIKIVDNSPSNKEKPFPNSTNINEIPCKNSIADEIRKLYQLKEDGIITEDEFVTQKMKLLEG